MLQICARQGAEKNLRVSAINRFSAHLFAYFFWRNRKSRPAERRLRCYRNRSTQVRPDKRADVGIGPYGGQGVLAQQKSMPAERQLWCYRPHGSPVTTGSSGRTESSAPTDYGAKLPAKQQLRCPRIQRQFRCLTEKIARVLWAQKISPAEAGLIFRKA